MARGGRRTGSQGKAYSNRSDLNTARAPSMPTVAPAAGQPYGAQASQIRSLAALPLAPTAPPAPAATGTPAAPPTPMPDINRPTERPGEPVTSGAALGPGNGPPPNAPSADPERLRAWLPALEIMAEQADASDETRNAVRYWRSMLS